MQQITVLQGENSYTIRKEKMRWKQEFSTRQGPENLFLADAKTTTFNALHNECQIAPFIAEKRLIVLDGLPVNAQREDVQLLNKLLHPQVHILCILQRVTGKKSKPTNAEKELLASASVREFPLLTSSQLRKWLVEEVRKCSSDGIDPFAAEFLLNYVGSNQDLLESEVQKLALYVQNRCISLEDVQKLVTCTPEQDVWKLLNFLAAENSRGALQYVHTLIEKGYSPQVLWGILLWMMSILTDVVAHIESGEKNIWKMAGSIRANPQSIKTVLPALSTMDRSVLRRTSHFLLRADVDLKTGSYKSTRESPEEILALIDRSLYLFQSP
jgi:DNA polymerase III subunit delta